MRGNANAEVGVICVEPVLTWPRRCDAAAPNRSMTRPLGFVAQAVNPGYDTGLATTTDVDTAGVHAMHVRIAAEGRIAFDSVLTVEELHSNLAAWMRGGSAFGGAIPEEHGLGMGRNDTYLVIAPSSLLQNGR